MRTQELVAGEEVVVDVHGAPAGTDERLALLHPFQHVPGKLLPEVGHDRGRGRAGRPRVDLHRDGIVAAYHYRAILQADHVRKRAVEGRVDPRGGRPRTHEAAPLQLAGAAAEELHRIQVPAV